MKKALLLGLGFGVLVSCSTSTTEEVVEEETPVIELGEAYGKVKVDPAAAITVAEMMKDYEGKTEEKEYTFEAKISETCSKAGCWINVDKGDGETFMVIFKDHFGIPTDTKVGSEAYLHGVAYWDTVSVDMLRHFAEDAGKSEEEIMAITEPKYELGFEADGIVMKK